MMTDADDRSKKEMNAGVALLLERMKTNPEEFNGEVNKWGNLLQYYKAYLDPEDANALNEGINKLLQQKFTEKVLEELVDPKSVLNPYLATPTAMPLGGATQGLSLTASPNTSSGMTWATTTATGTITAPSLTIGDTTLSEAGLRQMLATHKLMRVEEKAKRWWNKSIPELLGGSK